MTDTIPLPFDLPSVQRKKLTVDFDGGNQSSDGGLLLLRQAGAGAGCVPAAPRCWARCARWPRRRGGVLGRRRGGGIRHEMFEMVMGRAAAIGCGHKDAIDLDRLRHDPL